MRMPIANETDWDLTGGPEWRCLECGRPSREYTDHTICFYCATGEEPMSNVVTFEFYSDTNLHNAYDELQLMSLDLLGREGGMLVVGFEDYQAMGESIYAIVKSNGGEILG